MQTSPTHRPPLDPRRLRRAAATLLAAGVVLALVAASPVPASPEGKPRVTIIGDSIMASFDYVPAARGVLGRGLDLRSDNAVCRRLVAPSCPFQGAVAATALEVVRANGTALGPTVVINVGYNDWSAVYDVDRVVRALRASGVKRIIWVTLRAVGPNASLYARANERIRAADRRAQDVVVADWDAHGRARSWFRADRLHLTPAGALALARLLRPLVA